MAETKTQARVYTIPLRKSIVEVARHRRAKKAISLVRRFTQRHMKTENILIGKALNEAIWQNGIRNPPGKVKVSVERVGDQVRVELEGHSWIDAIKAQPKKEKGNTLKDKLGSVLQNKTEEPEKKE